MFCIYILPLLVGILLPIYQISKKRSIINNMGDMIISSNRKMKKLGFITGFSIFTLIMGIVIHLMGSPLIGMLSSLYGISMLVSSINMHVYKDSEGLYQNGFFFSTEPYPWKDIHSWFIDNNEICNVRTKKGVVVSLTFFNSQETIKQTLTDSIPDKQRDD